MVQKYHPVWINTHFNHANEMTEESQAACDRLVRAGVPLSNQSVLLRGVNDDPETMLQLCRALFRSRVRPYYLYQCDLTRGVEHFRTPISRGIEIMEYLRGRLGGLAIPQYIVDAPHGGGKIPVGPNYIVSASPTHTVLRNFEGLMVSYPEPVTQGPVSSPLACRRGGSAPARRSLRGGVAALASGQLNCLVPEGADRMARRRKIHHGQSARFKPEKYQQKKFLADLSDMVAEVRPKVGNGDGDGEGNGGNGHGNGHGARAGDGDAPLLGEKDLATGEFPMPG